MTSSIFDSIKIEENIQDQLQAIFDRVANHLLTQGVRAYDTRKNICAYRTHNGLKCAVGCLIKDEYYDSNIEGISISTYMGFNMYENSISSVKLRSLQLKDSLQKSGIDIENSKILNLLLRLQVIHDNEDVANIKPALKNLAEIFGFKFNG